MYSIHLEKYAPEKQEYIRTNQANSMDSKLNHTIMLHWKLRNKGAYIKYVGGGTGGFYKFFKKNFVPRRP